MNKIQKTWTSTKAANIALIKYMGKVDANTNTPSNPSFSYTLNEQQSTVTLNQTKNPTDHWEPLSTGFEISKKAQERFLKHLAWLKKQLGITENFIIKSGNNFPSDCGLASSASSFAALTDCTAKAAKDLVDANLSTTEIARLSQQGSGSSCRSFFHPWAIWEKNSVKSITLPYTNLRHNVIVIDPTPKAVSSSEAHHRVTTSPLFEGRPQRAQERLDLLLNALKNQDWQQAFSITWEEFQDMRALFETAKKPFSYMQPNTLKVLDYLKTDWNNNGDGPLVTMDAGPNIHLLFRKDQAAKREQMLRNLDEFTHTHV